MMAGFWAIDLISIIRTLGEGEAELEVLTTGTSSAVSEASPTHPV